MEPKSMVFLKNRYLKKKEEEIASKKKVLESINTGLKESVSKIKP